MSRELGTLPNKIAVEGHTDSKPFSEKTNYSNWELSVERANAARRLTQENGIREDQILQVRGFVDLHLCEEDAPLDPSNRRVSLIVEYLNRNKDDCDEPTSGAAKERPNPRPGNSQNRLPKENRSRVDYRNASWHGRLAAVLSYVERRKIAGGGTEPQHPIFNLLRDSYILYSRGDAGA